MQKRKGRGLFCSLSNPPPFAPPSGADPGRVHQNSGSSLGCLDSPEILSTPERSMAGERSHSQSGLRPAAFPHARATLTHGLTTTGFPAKKRLRNKRQNITLISVTTQIWVVLLIGRNATSTNQKHILTHHQHRISSPVPQTDPFVGIAVVLPPTVTQIATAYTTLSVHSHLYYILHFIICTIFFTAQS